jgi:hypothetical protein
MIPIDGLSSFTGHADVKLSFQGILAFLYDG